MRTCLLSFAVLSGCLLNAAGLIIGPACPAGHCCRGAAAPPACAALLMQESEPDAEAAESEPDAGAEDGVSDEFTEDLLQALSADDTPLSVFDEHPSFQKSENPTVTLTPRIAYTNQQLVFDARKVYKKHETDSGSTLVQIAVLTARIKYMTSHMQKHKKDYASLRGLTRMVTRRRKLLEYLLKEDLDEFKKITADLGIRTTQLLKPKLQGARGRRV